MKRPTSILMVFCCLSTAAVPALAQDSVLAPFPAEVAPGEDGTLSLLEYTLAYRLEEARTLEQAGRKEEAAAAYNALLALCDNADGLTAQAWLRTAAFKARQGNKAEAVEMWCAVPAKFARIPWALVEARERLSSEGGACLGAARDGSVMPASASRPLTLDLKEASFARVGDLFREVLGVRLDIDPALSDRRVTVKLQNMKAGEALELMATQVGARVESVPGGLRVVAVTRPAPPSDAPAAKDVALRGTLDKEAIRGVVRAHIGEVQGCFEKRLAGSGAAVSVRVVASWTITAAGDVTGAQIKNSATLGPDMATCMSTAISAWKFPKPRGGGVVEVSYPFIFRSAEP